MASPPAVRLLPNAITVLAMCSGLSSSYFALGGRFDFAIGAIAVAAVLDSLDGRIARLLDATSRMGAELDSLSDAIAFGVAPALVLYLWKLEEGGRGGWIIALIFAVCIILRLARFNTLIDDTEQRPYQKEFFVGVPSPAGGLLALLPLIVSLAIGDAERTGWWTNQLVVSAWTITVGALLISRVPTLSVKTIRVPARWVAVLLIGVAVLAAAVVTYPFWALGTAMVVYLLHVPYAVWRHHWLAGHPEEWDVPAHERRAIRREHGARRLGLRPPLRRLVAGAARRAVRLPRRDENPVDVVRAVRMPTGSGARSTRRWRRVGLRRDQTNRPADR